MTAPDLYLDLDGTILDVAARNHRVHVESVRALGGESRLSLEAFWREKRAGLTNARLLEREGLVPRVDPRRYGERFLAAIELDELQALDALLPGAREALEALAARHTLVVVTLRREREPLLRSLARLGVDRLVSDVLSASPLDAPGEHTKAALVRGRARAIVGASWIVGDTEIDVRAGKALGLRTCAVTSGIRDEARLSLETPDLLVPHLGAFAALRARED